MYRLMIIWLGKLLLMAARLRGGSGSAIPGLVVEKIYPDFIAKMAPQLQDGSVLITGTNGKTTTTKLLAGILQGSGKQLVINRAGSNLSRGVASAILEHTGWSGRLRGDFGLFEVDEAHMPNLAAKLKPKAIVVLNLHRDQLDRYGELDYAASLIARALKHTKMAILNTDDPLVVGLAEFAKPNQAFFYGAAKEIAAMVPADAAIFGEQKTPKHPQRGAAENRKREQKPDLLLEAIKPTSSGQQLTINYSGKSHKAAINLAGIYNGYNTAAAILTAIELGIKPETAIKQIALVPAAFGRTEQIQIAGKKIQLILIKNPAGFNQIIRTFLTTSKGAPILMAINDNIADGRDVSWLWDVDFEPLADRGHHILCSGIRGYDLAVRLKYAETKSLVDTNLEAALSSFLQRLKHGETGYIVPTYTAMLALRKLLSRRAKLHKMHRYEAELGA